MIDGMQDDFPRSAPPMPQFDAPILRRPLGRNSPRCQPGNCRRKSLGRRRASRATTSLALAVSRGRPGCRDATLPPLSQAAEAPGSRGNVRPTWRAGQVWKTSSSPCSEASSGGSARASMTYPMGTSCGNCCWSSPSTRIRRTPSYLHAAKRDAHRTINGEEARRRLEMQVNAEGPGIPI